MSSIPLSKVHSGVPAIVSGIQGKDDVRRFLATLGFVEGSQVIVVSELFGNVIINVKGTRVAVSNAMAAEINVCTP